VGTILGLEASTYLVDLSREGLIYCDPSRELNFWRPAPEALLALGLRSKSDIPALKELEAWFDTQEKAQRSRPQSVLQGRWARGKGVAHAQLAYRSRNLRSA
jgi:hypothetical protein